MNEINIDAVPENIHWGYLDAALKPIRTVEESGDTVVLDTLPAALKEDLPPDVSWLTADHKEALAKVPLGGPPGLFVNGVGPHMSLDQFMSMELCPGTYYKLIYWRLSLSRIGAFQPSS